MNKNTFHKIHHSMHEYIAKGKKSPYKKKQIKRLVVILDDIITNEGDSRLEAIGKKQIIRYWKRTTDEKVQTRREKYSILKRFFSSYNVKITVPEPFEF